MTGQIVRPWIAVNEHMDDEYRSIVVQLALRYWPQASPELRQFADEFLSYIAVPGFRSLRKAPVAVAGPYVIKAFKKRQSVTSAIICLWSETQAEIIKELSIKAREACIKFKAEWTWQDAKTGYYEYDDIPELHHLMESIVDGKEKPEHDHFYLATLWLSRAIIKPTESEKKQEGENKQDADKIKDEHSSGDTAYEPPNLPCTPLETTDTELVLTTNRESSSSPIDENQISDKTGMTTPGIEAHSNQSQKNQESDKMDQLDLQEVSLVDILIQWSNASKKIDLSRKITVEFLKELHDKILEEKINLPYIIAGQVASSVASWETSHRFFIEFATAAYLRLQQEYQLRPDLAKPDFQIMNIQKDSDISVSSIIQAGTNYIQTILDYDQKKNNIEEHLASIREEIVKTQQALLIWSEDFENKETLFPEQEDADEMTLVDLEKTFRHAEIIAQTLTSRHIQFREQSISRIRANITKLIELSEIDTNFEINGITLAALTLEDFLGWTDKDMRTFENTLVSTVNEKVVSAQRGNTVALVSKLKKQWDDQILAELLGCLASEKRGIEAFLLEFAAIKTHSRNLPNSYSKEVTTNLLNGLEQLSSTSKPFELLGWIAPAFLTGFNSLDKNSQAEICLIALAANLTSEYLQPGGYLWQVTTEWPIPEMTSWKKLWQCILLEEPIQIFSDQSEATLKSVLVSQRKEAEQALARDGAHFIRLSSLQSNRHRLLLGNKILPALAEKFAELKVLENTLNKAEPDRLPSQLIKLRIFLGEQVLPELEEVALWKRYDIGVYEDGIDEIEPFHRKISMRIISDCAEAVRNYGNALLGYWELKDTRSNGLNSYDLRNEFSRLTNLTALGQASFECIVHYQAKERIGWDELYANRLSLQHIIQEVLSQPACLIQLPHLAGNLVNRYLDWDAILLEVLSDIAEPLGPASAAQYLLSEKAPNQTLMLVQYLTLDQQKRAQELRSDFERQMNSLLPELLQLGGNIDSIASWHDVGRWGYLLGKIKDDIVLQRELKENRSRTIAEKSLEFRQSINNLDLDLFRIKQDLSSEVYELMVNGVAAARRASEMEDLFVNVEDFLREMTYRLEHNSWKQEELQVSVKGLEKAISRSVDSPEIQVVAEQLLFKLENGQLDDLRLSRNRIADSEINTRIDLLRNWLTIKQSRGLLIADLHQIGASATQNIFRYFAQMISMRKYRNAEGKEIAFTDPLVYEYWQLQFPRTAALDIPCILIALPGNPPAISDIKLLQEFIEEKEFLGDYFVLLFVPGCDDKVSRRFHGMGDGKGLVFIDDAALVRIILAEADSRNPVGRLRPMMLDAINANTNIFSVNQTVDARTAIFLGRDRLIDNIVRSGGNYPIYGGRRIGKSSLLKAVEQKLLRKNVQVVSYSLEGDKNLTDEAVTRQLADKIGLESVVRELDEFKPALFRYLDNNPEKTLVIMLDEIDRYVQVNKQRHTLIEALRAASDRYGNRFRVIIAGFMELFDCLSGRGPYTQTSDPWRRMLDNGGPLGNLTSVNAESIVTQGFLEIIGWTFENRAIPQLIVERTGGHPAFVQEFCLKILERVRDRGDRLIRIADIDNVFNDNDPKHSFIAYVRETLEMNLDPVGRYLIVMLAARPEESLGFTWDEIREIAETSNPPIPEDHLKRSLEYLSVTSVVREVSKLVYEYTVPDYPNILKRLGDTSHLDELEDDLKKELGNKSENH
jgi:hypothetical protein